MRDLLKRMSLGEGQPIFLAGDITSVHMAEAAIMGYSQIEGGYIALFRSDNKKELDEAMKKLEGLLEVSYL